VIVVGSAATLPPRKAFDEITRADAQTPAANGRRRVILRARPGSEEP
jgi:hypothetical protein